MYLKVIGYDVMKKYVCVVLLLLILSLVGCDQNINNTESSAEPEEYYYLIGEIIERESGREYYILRVNDTDNEYFVHGEQIKVYTLPCQTNYSVGTSIKVLFVEDRIRIQSDISSVYPESIFVVQDSG